MADYGTLRSRSVEGDIHRIVPSRYPAVSLFDVARSDEELQMLAELEGLTNERLRQQLGAIQRLEPGEAVYGAGCTPIMAAFCHPSASRFTDGSFGIYYGACRVETAIAETRHHRELFMRAAGIPREVLEMRCYTTRLAEPMTLLPAGELRARILDPDDYSAGQRFGAALRERRCWGIYYNSVRDTPDGRCVGVLRPRALKPVTQTSHYRYFWDGRRIAEIEPYQRMQLR
ncbi:RES family NAD+ phosphorylase [Solimonas soli]|uniref:RES family NAD+ phosphorylase n=1 Tax=Solimonas soli TaxID=413479 RepID=UPI0004AC9812|nr:RES family NAD+ phosphorylase [Solimonas soli]